MLPDWTHPSSVRALWGTVMWWTWSSCLGDDVMWWVPQWLHTARGGEGLYRMEYGDMMEWILGTFGGPNYHHLTLGCTSSQYHVEFSGYASRQEEWEAFLCCCFSCVTYDTLQTVLFTRRRRRRSGLYYFHLTCQYLCKRRRVSHRILLLYTALSERSQENIITRNWVLSFIRSMVVDGSTPGSYRRMVAFSEETNFLNCSKSNKEGTTTRTSS